MNDDLLGYAVVVAVVIIPSLGLTARFALKPVVDAIIRLKEAFNAAPAPGGIVERKVLQVEEELLEVRRELQRLRDAESFQRAPSVGSAEATGDPSVPSGAANPGAGAPTMGAAGSPGAPGRKKALLAKYALAWLTPFTTIT
jgi:hypothetical protein